MGKEIKSVAISNGDSDDPILVTVTETTEPTINGIVVLNPDGTLLGE